MKKFPFSPAQRIILGATFVLMAATLYYETKYFSPSLVPHNIIFGNGSTVTPEVKDYGELPAFSLVDSHGKTFSKQNMKGKIWIANFIFASCSGPCPVLTEKMRKFHKDLPDTTRFISFSVDPERDTPGKLLQYAQMHDAESPRWAFVTGKKSTIYNLIRSGFTLAVQDDAKSLGATDDIIHTTRFVLIDKNARVRGFYNAALNEDLQSMVSDFKRITKLAAKPEKRKEKAKTS